MISNANTQYYRFGNEKTDLPPTPSKKHPNPHSKGLWECAQEEQEVRHPCLPLVAGVCQSGEHSE
jgi:hypothetical protein